MAKTASIPPVQGGTIEAAGLAFPDLLQFADNAFERYVKFKSFQTQEKAAQIENDTNSLLNEIQRQNAQTTTANPLGDVSPTVLLVGGGLVLLAVVLLIK